MMHSNNQKVVIYTDLDGKPLWFKFEGSGLIFPTVLTLWNNAYLANGKILYTPLNVLEVIQGGADLMIPGCFPPYPDLKKGDIAIFCSIPEKIPIGVGMVLVDRTDNLSRSMKGKAAQTVHTIGDTLVAQYKSQLAITPDVQFSYEVPYIVEEPETSAPLGEDGQATALAEAVSGLSTSETTPISTEQSSSTDISSLASTAYSSNKTSASISENPQDAFFQVKDTAEGDEGEEEDDEDIISTAEIDEIFRNALLQSIFKSIADGAHIDLPISASQLLSGHVLANMPFTSTKLNIKKTSWKKATKFFKVMEKEGLIKTKDHKDDLFIQSVAGLEHPLLQKFEPYEIGKRKKKKNPNAGASSSSQQLVAIELWKPHSAAVPFFQACASKPELPTQLFYDTEGLKLRLIGYINDKKLVHPKDKKSIQADDILVKALGLPKEAALNDNLRKVGRDKIVAMLQRQCTPFHVVYDPVNDPVLQQYKDARGNVSTANILRSIKPAKGHIPHITIATERRGGNKTVTTVVGLEAFGIDPNSFAEELRKTCAGSTSVNSIKPGGGGGGSSSSNSSNNNNNTNGGGSSGPDLKSVLIQGPQVRAIETALQKRGVKPGWIQVNDKVGGGKKGGKK